MDAQDGMAELSGMACNQAGTCPWAQTDPQMGMEVHTCMGDTATNKGTEGCSSAKSGGDSCSCATGPLPSSLG